MQIVGNWPLDLNAMPNANVDIYVKLKALIVEDHLAVQDRQ